MTLGNMRELGAPARLGLALRRLARATLSGACSEFMPTRPQHTGLFVRRRVEIPTLKIPNQAADCAFADFVASVEQFPEQRGQKLRPLGGRQRPGRIGDGGDLRVGEGNHGRLARLLAKAGDCRSRNKITRRLSSSDCFPGASLAPCREALTKKTSVTIGNLARHPDA